MLTSYYHQTINTATESKVCKNGAADTTLHLQLQLPPGIVYLNEAVFRYLREDVVCLAKDPAGVSVRGDQQL